MCGAKDFMLKKNLFKMVSLFTFVMLFLFNVVACDCLAKHPNGERPKTKNGYTQISDDYSSSAEDNDNDGAPVGGNSQINGANGENNNGGKNSN